MTQNDVDSGDFIDRYLMGQLSLWELAEIEKRIKSDPAFSEQVGFRRDLLIGITLSRRSDVKQQLIEFEARPRLLRLHVDREAILRYAIAACITLFVLSSVFYENMSNALTSNGKRGRISTMVQ